jgi:hypothetical protein
MSQYPPTYADVTASAAHQRYQGIRRSAGVMGSGYYLRMIKGAHILFYSKNPEADRAFFRDVLEFRTIDIGRCTEVDEAEWGIKTTIPLPSGSEIGLYQPKHETAI